MSIMNVDATHPTIASADPHGADSLMEVRQRLKAMIRSCREIERATWSPPWDRRRAARLRHAASGSLTLLRSAGR
jgi:type VI protein secretion system component VasF